MTASASELYQAGQLDEAIAAATEEVKHHPTDINRRGFLAELLCFAGQWERADKQLDLVGHQDPQAALGAGLLRHLVRAEQARQQFYSEGHLPEFLESPSARHRLHLEASIRVREGQLAEAAEMLARAEGDRPHVSGTVNDRPVDDVRDLDDLTASLFEVLTANGKFYWIPVERVESIEFRDPIRPRDLLWRSARLVVRGGLDGEVYFPAIYAGSHAHADEQLRLGRRTEWEGGEGAPTRGIGQRMFLAGDEAVGILDLKKVAIDAPQAEKADGPGAT